MTIIYVTCLHKQYMGKKGDDELKLRQITTILKITQQK
jgi:hypothetical protein